MKTKEIYFKRIILKPLSLKSASIFRRWFNDKKVTQNLIIQKSPSLAEEKKWIRKMILSKENHIWSIFVANEDKLIGNIDLRFDKKNKVGIFGIVIGEKEYWGKGYAYEAFKILIEYGFDKLKCNRLELRVYPENDRAVKLYKKLGFIYEGCERQKQYNKYSKKFRDDQIYSILRHEYKK